jgi:hypothetical protein
MKIVNTGNIYRIYDDSLQTYDELPAQVYLVRFSKMSGFFLEKYSDIEIKEKIYGVHEKKIKKVFHAFDVMERNVGVILSGDKGIGKSLFAKMVGKRAIENGLPLLLINEYVPGIANYLDSIEQECVVIFDEFDKTFGQISGQDVQNDPQTELLTLFDGLSQGKKMFVITCNKLRDINDYLINRPGRCHYHFRFEYPNADEIREYLKDKIDPEYYDEVENVVKFAQKIDLNYDCLRAIAFELGNGEKFSDAIKDLNIVNTDYHYYSVCMLLENGEKSYVRNLRLDLFAKEQHISFSFDKYDEIVAVFHSNNINFNTATGLGFIPEEKIQWEYEDDEDNAKNPIPSGIIIEKQNTNNIHYDV